MVGRGSFIQSGQEGLLEIFSKEDWDRCAKIQKSQAEAIPQSGGGVYKLSRHQEQQEEIPVLDGNTPGEEKNIPGSLTEPGMFYLPLWRRGAGMGRSPAPIYELRSSTRRTNSSISRVRHFSLWEKICR